MFYRREGNNGGPAQYGGVLSAGVFTPRFLLYEKYRKFIYI